MTESTWDFTDINQAFKDHRALGYANAGMGNYNICEENLYTPWVQYSIWKNQLYISDD